MFTIIKAQAKKHFDDIEYLANIIWRKHYTSIIGEAQVEYMLKNFQSSKKIENAVKNSGCHYFLVYCDSIQTGYFAYTIVNNSLFLSKLYILDEMRGIGAGKFCFTECLNTAKQKNLSKIWLTVNRNNLDSIKAYEKMGFKKVREQKEDIGGGFVMDDFIMEYPVYY